MSRQDFGRQFFRLLEAKDHREMARLLDTHPKTLTDLDFAASMISTAARSGDAAAVRLLLDRGVSVNASESESGRDRPIDDAVYAKSAETVRLLLDRGSDVNWGWEGGPIYCVPIFSAIVDGCLDIVKLLVEAGADLTALDRTGQTPLAWAIGYGQKEIEAYLLSQGAVETKNAPGYVEPPPTDPFDDALAAAGIQAFDEPVATAGEVSLWLGTGPVDSDGFVLFTRGMSKRAMTAPRGGKAYRHAELVLYLDSVDNFAFDEWPDSEYWWLIDWMLRVARWPFDNATWLNGKWTIISNEDPPEPLSEHTAMTCWLLLGEKEPLARVELPDGKSTCFYTMMPIHTAERDLALNEGLEALLLLFAEHDLPMQIDPQRESVV